MTPGEKDQQGTNRIVLVKKIIMKDGPTVCELIVFISVAYCNRECVCKNVTDFYINGNGCYISCEWACGSGRL